MNRRLAMIAAMCLLTASHAHPAAAATQIGETFPPSENCTANYTVLQGSFVPNPSPVSYAAPSAGVITSWSFQAPATAPPQLKLKVGRPAGAANYTIVGESDLKSPPANALTTFLIRVPVQAGDLIGFYSPGTGLCSGNPAPGYEFQSNNSDVPLGTTSAFGQLSDHRLDLSAVVEPDCDSDGFGDETQDGDVASCTPAPETTITKGPKDKTKKKQATFEFTANQAGATFECSLDGGAFAPCTSPQAYTVKRGKHGFEVRASSGGQTDGSPATDTWKVKRKKK